ncbi:conserved hypothetical protein [Coccidioides posadasii str. Silveira]|uniref:Uncharacterized protein n=2 Tax=Coccidioides posadasii TaxID=199306 RepID=E9DI44_COCPS|nr:conserved hypothetical protein [Coccidioides posadasii str. Silveira]KMM67874.1 hypothetical protein CPAG_04207 [Coccidioides posadasii RMSCC 3488]
MASLGKPCIFCIDSSRCEVRHTYASTTLVVCFDSRISLHRDPRKQFRPLLNTLNNRRQDSVTQKIANLPREVTAGERSWRVACLEVAVEGYIVGWADTDALRWHGYARRHCSIYSVKHAPPKNDILLQF